MFCTWGFFVFLPAFRTELKQRSIRRLTAKANELDGDSFMLREAGSRYATGIYARADQTALRLRDVDQL